MYNAPLFFEFSRTPFVKGRTETKSRNADVSNPEIEIGDSEPCLAQRRHSIAEDSNPFISPARQEAASL